MALSALSRRVVFSSFNAQFSHPWRITLRTQAPNSLPFLHSENLLEVNTGKISLNLPKPHLILVTTLSNAPPPHLLCPRIAEGVHCFQCHAIQYKGGRPLLLDMVTCTNSTFKVWVFLRRGLIPLHLLCIHSPHELHFIEFLCTPLWHTANGCLPCFLTGAELLLLTITLVLPIFTLSPLLSMH